MDKAMANVGALLATEVEGRVCTEIDPRLANNKGELAELYRPHCQVQSTVKHLYSGRQYACT